ATSTYLERAYLPRDNHAWAKFYNTTDVSQFTPYDAGTAVAGAQPGISLCNLTPQGPTPGPPQAKTTSPRLPFARGPFPNWAAQESKQCMWACNSTSDNFTSNASNPGASPSDGTDGGTNVKLGEFTVRNQVCNTSFLGSEKCKVYGTSYKPVGLLQD